MVLRRPRFLGATALVLVLVVVIGATTASSASARTMLVGVEDLGEVACRQIIDGDVECG